jgi:hypothetical protein
LIGGNGTAPLQARKKKILLFKNEMSSKFQFHLLLENQDVVHTVSCHVWLTRLSNNTCELLAESKARSIKILASSRAASTACFPVM